MSHQALYRDTLSLLTDLYQLTMAYSYWKSATAHKEAVFTMSFRHNPFQGGFAIACGLERMIEYLQSMRFDESDISYLATLLGTDSKPLFETEFLSYLQTMRFDCDIDAVAEGTVVFAHEPIVRVRGPIIPCQILETALLNIIGYETLIATKAARIRIAAGSQSILEFGLRRAQGADGALSASRAAYVGGCDATSNVLAGKLYGIPVKGTHAHSWVMSFTSELESFKAYAQAMPNNCVFLVDTYDTQDGVKHAIEIGRELVLHGHKLAGIRLDSGDLAYLSIVARKLLDEAGFDETQIVASNDLDEHVIKSLNDQGARIDVWGVGTKLVTAADQPSLGCVYKLACIRQDDGPWQYKVKLSEQAIKVSTPGIQQIRRFSGSDNLFVADMIFDDSCPPTQERTLIDPIDFTRRKTVPNTASYEDLLTPIFRKGKLVYVIPDILQIKERTCDQVSRLHPAIKRLLNPHQYPVGLETSLHKKKTELILAERKLHESMLQAVD